MTINLENNKIAFGLLSKEEQEHLMTWPHGLLYYEGGNSWWPCEKDDMEDYYIYRTIPAPVEPKRETVWLAPAEFNDMRPEWLRSDAKYALEKHGGFAFRIEFDATTGDNPTIVKETFDG